MIEVILLLGGQYLNLCLHLILDRLLEGKKLVNVPVVLKAPAKKTQYKLCVSSVLTKNARSLTLLAV